MQAKITDRTAERAVAAVEALDLEPIKLRVMDAERGEGWTSERAESVERAYRTYLAMLVKHPEAMESLVVSRDVDEFWHTHILHTMKYTADCQSVFGTYLHHNPQIEARSSADIERTRRLYDSAVSRLSDGGSAYCSAAVKVEQPAYCSAVRAEQPAYCSAVVRAEQPAYCSAAVKAEQPAYCSAVVRAEQPAYCSAAVKAEQPAYCSAAVKAEQPAYCSAAVKAEQPAYCSAAVRAEQPAYCSAAVKAEQSAYCSAAVKAEQPAYCSAIRGGKAAYCSAAVGA
jgi:hypothetical protein